MFVALESPDGGGKTTLCPILAELLGATVYATPPKKYLKKRGEVDKNASDEEHYRFYRDGIYDASDEIRRILKGGDRIVSDRYWLSTYTYHQVMGVAVSKNDFAHVVQPDLTVILTLDYETRMARMSNRGLSAGDHRLLGKQRELAEAFLRNVAELNIPFVVVDTGCFSPTECASMIAEALGTA